MVVSLNQLSALLARVEKAEGPDRIIELDLHDALLGRLHCEPFAPEDGSRIPHYTASLDASLALCERVLPGWFVGLQQNRHHNKPIDWTAYIERDTKSEQEATASTSALALLAAMLRALIAQHNTSDIQGVVKGDAR